MILISIICLALTAMVIVELSIGFSSLADLNDQHGESSSATTVSVIVPACNEEEKIEAGLGDAPIEKRRKLLFDNAAKLYKVDTPPTAR